jgi:hypothetical protein
MMFTHEQLIAAIRAVGRDGKPFSSAAVRGNLGMTTQDRRAQTRFNNEFRAFQKAMGSELEKLANNRYRFNPAAPVSDVAEAAPAAVTMMVAPAALAPAPVVTPVIEVRREEVQLIATELAHEPSPVAEAFVSEVRKPTQSFNVRAAIVMLLQPVLKVARESGYELKRRVSEWISRASGLVSARAHA